MIIVTKEVIITNKMGKIKIQIIQLQPQSEVILGQIEGIPEGETEKKPYSGQKCSKKATLSNLKNYYAYIYYLIIPNKWYFMSKVDSISKSIYLFLGLDFTYLSILKVI